MRALEGLKPERVFYYFEEISKIPRGSGDTLAVSNYCVDFAKAHGLEFYQDEFENVIIIKEASKGYEASETVMLQGHLDMVNEKQSDSLHDFKKDPLKLMVDGDWITADGTTLGGDDGIAAAYALAILEADDLEHPRLECVFTTDEEVGMSGAMGLDCSFLKAKYLINLDSEDEGVFLTSCAGGVSCKITMPVKRINVDAKVIELTLKNLTGGHSGCEIDKERANALILAGRLLNELREKADYDLCAIDGGFKDNAIPRACTLTLAVNPEDFDLIKENAFELVNTYKAEHAVSDPDMELEIADKGKMNISALSPSSAQKLIFMLNFAPNGIQGMSLDIPGLVETSLNLGIISTADDIIKLTFSVRSSVLSKKQALENKLKYIAEFFGCDFETSGSYPAWEYRRESYLRELFCSTYEELTGNKARLEAIHAGLECGLIGEKMPDIDIVSLGPDIKDIHTTEERLSIASVERVYKLVLEVLRKLK